MTVAAHLRKEIAQTLRDPAGLVLALAVPLLIVWVYSLLGLEATALPDRFRETSPVGLILCLSVWLSALTMASTSLYRERTAGTLERLTATPFSPGLMILAKALVLVTVSLGQAVIVWMSGSILLAEEMPYARPVGGILTLFALACAAVALGIFLSALLTSATQISNAVTFATLGVITLSGFFKPLDELGAVGGLGQVLPFTLGYGAIRDLVERGASSADAVVSLLVEAVLLMTASLVLLKTVARPKLEA